MLPLPGMPLPPPAYWGLVLVPKAGWQVSGCLHSLSSGHSALWALTGLHGGQVPWWDLWARGSSSGVPCAWGSGGQASRCTLGHGHGGTPCLPGGAVWMCDGVVEGPQPVLCWPCTPMGVAVVWCTALLSVYMVGAVMSGTINPIQDGGAKGWEWW